MRSTRTPKALASTAHYELMLDERDDRTVYEIWTEDFGHHELNITVHLPQAYGNATIDAYLGYEATNIQNSELAAAFAEAFTLATYQFAAIEKEQA